MESKEAFMIQLRTHLETKILLSTLWTFVVLNIFARDFHELARPGMLEQMIAGVVNGVVITEELMLMGGIMMEVPIIMVPLSQILKYRLNRCANMLIGAIAIVFVFINNQNPDLDDTFFMIIEIAALLGIIWTAWRWKNQVALTA